MDMLKTVNKKDPYSLMIMKLPYYPWTIHIEFLCDREINYLIQAPIFLWISTLQQSILLSQLIQNSVLSVR